MKFLKFFLIVMILFPLSIVNAEENDKRNKITKNLRCLICQGQSVYDSDSEFANSLKLVVMKKLESGNSEEQIYDFLQEKYGEWILYDPKFNKNTYLENDEKRIREMLIRHINYTNSSVAKVIIENFNEEIKNFVKVLPLDFKAALKKVKVEDKIGKDRLWQK